MYPFDTNSGFMSTSADLQRETSKPQQSKNNNEEEQTEVNREHTAKTEDTYREGRLHD